MTHDRLAILCLLACMLLLPAFLGAVQQLDYRRELAQTPVAVVRLATWAPSTATPLPSRGWPTMVFRERTPAPVMVLEVPTPNVWAMQPGPGLAETQIARAQ